MPAVLSPQASPGNTSALAAPRLRRLTVPQYQNSVRDLFGDGVKPPAELEPDAVIAGFASIGAAQSALSPRATELFESAARDVAHQALANPSTRMTLVGCAPGGAGDDSCVRAFLQRLGKRAWRRPVEASELQPYVKLASDGASALSDPWAGLEYAVAGMLLSPYFLYRVELGQPDTADASRRVLDGFELATRLSFLLWNSTPDDALLGSAEQGALASADGLLVEAQRMLNSPRARGAFGNFWMEMLRLGELDSLPQLPANYPQMSATLGASLRDETLALLDDIVFARDGDYRQLFDSRSTFVNDELAKLYALTVPAGGPGMRPVQLPADSGRMGLLGQGSFLALNAHSTMTSPTLRGKYVREVLLCQSIPAPPANVDTKIPDDPAGNTPRTMRQKLEFHRSVATCAGCHQLMDPLGLALEHFDGIGAYRATDRGMPIDASGTLDGKDYDGAAALAAALRDHPDVGGCLARNLFRYVAGHLETPEEAPAIAALGNGLVSGGFHVKQLLLDVIRSNVFRYQGQLD